MNYVQRRAASPLDLFVEWLWVCRNEPAPRRIERVLPTGAAQIVVNLAEDQTRTYSGGPQGLVCTTASGSVLSGIACRAQYIDTDEQSYVAGISFRPGGTLPFVAHPADELADRDVPLDAVWGAAATQRLRERLLSSRTPLAALDALEQTLREAWRDHAVHPAVTFALRHFAAHPTVARVAEVRSVIGLSEKRFIERFQAQVGVTPKRFCRIRRFQHVVSTAHPLRAIDWADLAACCGYADQAHLIHEFREFSGMTPGTYEQCRTWFQNHVSFLQSERPDTSLHSQHG